MSATGEYRQLWTSMLLALLAVLLAAQAAAQASPPPRVLIWFEILKGNEDDALRWPVAVAAGSQGEILVADAYGPRLLKFTRLGASWQLERVVRLLGPPIGLVHQEGGRYLASLRGQPNLVSIEGPDLRQRAVGLPRGVMAGPLAALPGDHLLLFDYAGERVIKLDGKGELLAEIEVAGRVTALAPASDGGFLAAVPQSGAVLRFGADWQLDETWDLPDTEGVPPWPVGIAVEIGGDVFVSDRHGARILVLDALGQVKGVGSRNGWEPGLLRQPAGLARFPDGSIVIADQGNGRVQIFGPTNRPATP